MLWNRPNKLKLVIYVAKPFVQRDIHVRIREQSLSIPGAIWVKSLTQGPNGDITPPAVGLKPVTFRSQAQSPNPLSHTPPDENFIRLIPIGEKHLPDTETQV